MQFCLTYDGLLPSNGTAKQKHVIRRALHPQMKELRRLMRFEPRLPELNVVSQAPGGGMISLAFPVGEFIFLPFVTARLKLVAELDILLLRRQEPGAIVTTGGDIDNRVKTVLDALRIPKVADEIPAGASPTDDEKPFCCLLEDDVLVTKLAITTDRLLEPGDKSRVRLIIRVEATPTKVTLDNLMVL